MTKSYKIKAYNLETRELIGEYNTMLELAEAFDLTLQAVQSYFQRYKIFGEARIRNQNTHTWCYLVRQETKKIPNYKERCLKAIEYVKQKSFSKEVNMYLELTKEEVVKLLEILNADGEEYYI